jgi:hypothetical protein
MENKGTEEKITYPSIYFSIDNFEDVRLLKKIIQWLIDFLLGFLWNGCEWRADGMCRISCKKSGFKWCKSLISWFD